MRGFMVVCLLATAAYGDVSHLGGGGYTYEAANGGHGGLGGLGGFGGHSGSGILGGSIQGGSTYGVSGGLVSNGGFTAGGGQTTFGSTGGDHSGLGQTGFTTGGGQTTFGNTGGDHSGLGQTGFTTGGLGHSGAGIVSHGGFNTGSGDFATHYTAPAQAEFTKTFYTYDAPEDDFIDAEQLRRATESLKSNLQVVFIKAPENKGLENAALSLAKSTVDSRTAIYVLHKQADITNLANRLQSLNNHNAHKPEVHFVKYRTPEDAANAQNAIQSQYDHLGGATVHQHGGVAPVLNFASSYAPAYHHAVGHQGHPVASGGSVYSGFGHGGAVHGGSVHTAAAHGGSIHSGTVHTGLVQDGAAHGVSVGGVNVGSGASGITYTAPSQVYLPA